MNKYDVRITPGSGNYIYIDDIGTVLWPTGRWVEISQRENNELRVNCVEGQGAAIALTTHRIDQAFDWAGKWITEGVLRNA